MSTSIEPVIATGEGTDPENLGLLHLAAERKHDRPSTLRRRTGAAWQDTPDWRFHRQVMRMGLYLRERAQLGARDRVAVVAKMGPELAVAAWGALALGAPVAMLDPGLPDAELGAQLAALGPRVVCAEGAAADRVRALRVPGVDTVIAIGTNATEEAREKNLVLWSEALDLGGSLDTAERANAFRAHARGLPPETPAIGHVARSNGAANGSVVWRFLTHRDVVRRVQRVWVRARIASGDVAYLASSAPTIASLTELLAFTSDGYSQVVTGTEGRELEEIAMVRPHKIVAAPEVVRRLLESIPSSEPSAVQRLLARVPQIARRLDHDAQAARASGALGRARWISTGPSLDFAARAKARRFITLEIDDSLS